VSSIFELLLKLPTITEVAITCHSKNNILYPLQNTILNLQLAYYWWQEAQEDLRKYNVGVELTEGEHERKMATRPPTLIGVFDQLNYMEKQLRDLEIGTKNYLETASPLPDDVKYKVEQGYNKVMEAKFNINISTKYYEQYNRQQGN